METVMVLPLHHHDMESHVICDKNGKAVIELNDDLDSEYILCAINKYERLIKVINETKHMTNELLRTMDDDHWYRDDLVKLRVMVIKALAAEGK